MAEKTIELLSPAGDMERLRMSLAYGADAVYLAGPDFGMRSFAGNFTPEELRQAVELCHSRGVAVHVTCNTMPRNDEAARLPEWLEFLQAAGVDAAILADVGVLSLLKKHAPGVKAHISTQASVSNYQAAAAWYELGASRVIRGPGAVPGRDPGDPGQGPPGAGAGGLRPRGHVRQLLGPLPAVQLHDGAGRQPGRLRPALPLPVRLGGGEAPPASISPSGRTRAGPSSSTPGTCA